MSKLFSSLILIAAIFLAGCHGCRNNNARLPLIQNPTRRDAALNSVVAFIRENEDGTQAVFCSGFFVTDTLIVTSEHCVNPLAQLQNVNPALGFLSYLFDPIGSEHEFVIHAEYKRWVRAGNEQDQITTSRARVVAMDKEHDIVLLETAVYMSPYWISIDPLSYQVGEPVYAVGNQYGAPWIITSGHIAQYFYVEGEVFGYYATALNGPGGSGGVLLNELGHAVGITHAVVNYNGSFVNHLSVYIRSVYIRDLLDTFKDEHNYHHD